jgi:hypothetical protein
MKDPWKNEPIKFTCKFNPIQHTESGDNIILTCVGDDGSELILERIGNLFSTASPTIQWAKSAIHNWTRKSINKNIEQFKSNTIAHAKKIAEAEAAANPVEETEEVATEEGATEEVAAEDAATEEAPAADEAPASE